MRFSQNIIRYKQYIFDNIEYSYEFIKKPLKMLLKLNLHNLSVTNFQADFCEKIIGDLKQKGVGHE